MSLKVRQACVPTCWGVGGNSETLSATTLFLCSYCSYLYKRPIWNRGEEGVQGAWGNSSKEVGTVGTRNKVSLTGSAYP
jgi:hypothetical protein